MATAPTLRASSLGASTGTGLTASHTIPSAVQVGDFMVASIRTAANTGTIATPTNWTLIQGPTRSTSAMSLATYWKVAEASDTGGAATVSSGLQSSVAWVVQFAAYQGGFKRANNSALADNTSNTVVQWTGISTQYDNEIVLHITAGDNTANTFTPPTGFAEQRDGNGMTLATQTYATPTATGNVSGATSANQRTITHVMSIRPVPDPVTGLVDAFTGTTISSVRWNSTNNAPATITQNNVLICTLAANTAGSIAAYVDSKQPFTLDELSVFVEWPQVPASNANVVQAFLAVVADNDTNLLRWVFNNGNIQAAKQINNVVTTVYTNTYSATDHRWLRIREAGGTVYWDTSADGLNWTNRWSEAAPFGVNDFRIYLQAYTVASVASPGVGHHDNLNNPPAVTYVPNRRPRMYLLAR